MKTHEERPLVPVELDTEMAAVFDLEALAQNLLTEAEGTASGRSAATLLKHPGLKIVLIALRAGAELKEHSAGGPAVITCVLGQVDMTVGAETTSLKAGQTIAFAPSTRHGVRAPADGAIQLVIGEKPRT